MNSYKLFAIILPLSIALSFTGCTTIKDSPGVQTENNLSAEVAEHTISFKAHGDVPLINCNINGHEAVPFLLDTGASTNILDIEYAKSIGILATSEEYLSLQGHPIRDLTVDELKIGTLRLSDIHARAMDLRAVLPDDFPAKGILGYPIFRPHEICIDYPNHTVSFRQGAYRKLEKPYEPVFTYVVLPVWIESQGPFNFIFDTGNNMSVVESHVLGELVPPIAETVPVVRMKMDDVGEAFCWIRKGNIIGLSDARSEGISNAREFIRRACGFRIDGVLGWRHMKDYKITINYPTNTYQFEKIGYPPELKPVVVNVTPDLSKDINLPVKKIVFEFSVPMSQRISYLTTFECNYHWQNDTHLTLTLQEELMAGKEYQVILGHGLCSKKNVPLDWTIYQLKVVYNQ
jgi:hypothetical protein